ncbi:MAG: 50S ribosomal protein L22 [Clostridiales bacterium]|nr:50S ribosomal protein L22 [Clostridiales bacterium]
MALNQKLRAQRRKENADRRTRATAKYIRISSRKVKIVIDLIRGKSATEARAILMFTPKAAAAPVLKVLNSAIANAENNLNLSTDNLFVAETYANQGPTLKRFRARAKGSASRILKRTSHITIVLDTAN